MKLVGLKLAYIKSFKTLDWNIARTKVIIGQNDHGKSSILKILNFVLNEITDYHLDQGFLEPAISEEPADKKLLGDIVRRWAEPV